MTAKKKKITIGGVAIDLVFIALCATCLIPILMVAAVSFTTEADIMAHGYRLFPEHLTLEGYEVIFKNPKSIMTGYRVTILTTVIGAPLGVLINAMFAYTQSRKDFKFRRPLSLYMTFTMLFSGGLVPTYIMITQYLKLGNTLAVLIVPGLVNVWYIFLLKFFFDTIPATLVEAAKLDGAGEMMIFFRIMLPLARTGLVTILLFFTLAYWGAWQGSLYYITDDSKYQLQYMLQRMMNNIDFVTQHISEMPEGMSLKDLPKESTRMAMCLLTAGPMLVIFPFFQKYFVQGITVGAVKG